MIRALILFAVVLCAGCGPKSAAPAAAVPVQLYYQVEVFKDFGTGCEYVAPLTSQAARALTPRMNRSGQQVCTGGGK